MASVVKICNMAVSHCGEDTVVQSISPPDGSQVSSYCGTFYDQARTEMLEVGNWGFSRVRATLALLTNDSQTWFYKYQLPSDCLKPKRVLGAIPAILLPIWDQACCGFAVANYMRDDDDSAPYQIEGRALYTNQPEATLVYIRDVQDTSKYTPSFTAALGYMLGSYLAGPIVKGVAGLNLGQGLRQMANSIAATSATVDANASHASADHIPHHLVARS